MAAKSNKAATKSAILADIAEQTGLTRKQVSAVFDQIAQLTSSYLRKPDGGVFALPGLVKFRLVHKPATQEREGTNPFTGQPMTIKAKPARKVVKAVPLKALKDMVK